MMTDLFQLLDIDVLTFLHWMLALSLSLFILDIFIQTEFLSWLSLILFAAYFTLLIQTHWLLPIQWSFIIFFLFLVLAFVFYFLEWSRVIKPIIQKSLLKHATAEHDERAVGGTGIFRIIDGQYFVEWDGILWKAVKGENCPPLSQLCDCEKVTITKSEAGTLSIEKQ